VLGHDINQSIEDLHALALSQLHILLVHPDNETARTIQATVERLDHDCELVTSVQAMAKRVQEKQFDLILLDASHPGDTDGVETLQKIRNSNSEALPEGTAVILLSAADGAQVWTPITSAHPSATSSTVPTSSNTGSVKLPAGVDEIIQKPVTSANLTAALTRHLSQRRPSSVVGSGL